MMDIMLHTSRIGESFGVSLVEGMYFGLPIVTNSTDYRDFTLFERDNSQTEIVQDSVNGYIEQTPEAMAQKIVALIQDVDTMQHIAQANKKYAEATFGSQVITNCLEKIYLTKALSPLLRYD
jgi:glycosyltransferase involved in cell wall biosynthesis